jgi:hypothetical protein
VRLGRRSHPSSEPGSVAGYISEDDLRATEDVSQTARQAAFAEALDRVRGHLLQTQPEFDYMAEVRPNQELLMTFPVWHLGRYTYPGGGSYSSGYCDVCMDANGLFYRGISGVHDPDAGFDRRAFTVFVEDTAWRPTRRERTPHVSAEEIPTYYISAYDQEAQEAAMRELMDAMGTRFPAAGGND